MFTCRICGEVLEQAEFLEHIQIPHEPKAYYDELRLALKISRENGLGVDRIMSLVESAYL